MAIIVTKESVDTPKQGYVSLFINNDGHLSSKDDQGLTRTFAEGVVNFFMSEPFSLSEADITSKSVEMPHYIVPGSVTFRIKGCLDQLEDDGFYVDGNMIRWDNYGLDGFLNQEDLIQIKYSFYN